MKKTIIPFIVLGLMLSAAGPYPASAADEDIKYNFASAQGASELKMPPGGERTAGIYFYNIDGNRITHIVLKVTENPDDWVVSVEPPEAETNVMVNGISVTLSENLYVEPSGLYDHEPAVAPEGSSFINIPGRGYSPAKEALITVRAPESAMPGETGKIVVSAEAFWLGQSGAAALRQARDYEIDVFVVSPESGYHESVAGPSPAASPLLTSAVGSDRSGPSAVRAWLPAIAAGIIVIAGLLVLILVYRKRRRS